MQCPFWCHMIWGYHLGVLEKEMATHSNIPAWKIPMDRGPWSGYSPWDCKESDTTKRLHFLSFYTFLGVWLLQRVCQALPYRAQPDQKLNIGGPDPCSPTAPEIDLSFPKIVTSRKPLRECCSLFLPGFLWGGLKLCMGSSAVAQAVGGWSLVDHPSWLRRF